MTSRHDAHAIVNRVRRWTVTQGGRTLSHHRTQWTTLSGARRAARRSRVELVIHGRNGRIRSKDSFGNESAARDTEH